MCIRDRRATGRVARRVNHIQLQLADADRLARTERSDVGYGWIWLEDFNLRIVATDLAGLQYLRSDIARDDFCTSHLLQLGDTAGVVVVHVRIQDELDVLDLESQLLHLSLIH